MDLKIESLNKSDKRKILNHAFKFGFLWFCVGFFCLLLFYVITTKTNDVEVLCFCGLFFGLFFIMGVFYFFKHFYLIIKGEKILITGIITDFIITPDSSNERYETDNLDYSIVIENIAEIKIKQDYSLLRLQNQLVQISFVVVYKPFSNKLYYFKGENIVLNIEKILV